MELQVNKRKMIIDTLALAMVLALNNGQFAVVSYDTFGLCFRDISNVLVHINF